MSTRGHLMDVFLLSIQGNRENRHPRIEPPEQDTRQLIDHPSLNWSPAWSPNGKWIAFVSDRAGSQDIYRINVDGQI